MLAPRAFRATRARHWILMSLVLGTTACEAEEMQLGEGVCLELDGHEARLPFDYFCNQFLRAGCRDFDEVLSARTDRTLRVYSECAEGRRMLRSYDIELSGGFSFTYDSDGKMLGGRVFSDVYAEPCNAVTYYAGDEAIDCGSGRECFVPAAESAGEGPEPDLCVDCVSGVMSLELACRLSNSRMGWFPGFGEGAPRCPGTFDDSRESMMNLFPELRLVRGCGYTRLLASSRNPASLAFEERVFDEAGVLVKLRSTLLGEFCQVAAGEEVVAGLELPSCAEETTCWLSGAETQRQPCGEL